MSRFQVGDIIKGITDSPYSVTNVEMTKGQVTQVNEEDNNITVKVLEHKRNVYIGRSYHVTSRYFKLVSPKDTFRVGDLVKGLNDDYGVTNTKMTKGLVTWVSNDRKTIKVQILEHEDEEGIGQTFSVDAEDFEKLDKGFRIGDIVKGITDKYAFTDTRMKKAKILDIYYDEDDEEQLLSLQILEHDNPIEIGNVYDDVKAIDFALIDTDVNEDKKEENISTNGLKVGDFITGTEKADELYYITDSKMVGRVEEISEDDESIIVKVIKHPNINYVGGEHVVNPKKFVRCTESGLKVGDFVKGTAESDYRFTCTNSSMKKAVITEILDKSNQDYDIKIKILEHEYDSEIGQLYCVPSSYFDRCARFSVGDLVKALPEADAQYTRTNTKMILGKVTKIYENNVDIEIEILEHEHDFCVGSSYKVESKYFKKVDKEDNLQVGDLIVAKPEADDKYSETNTDMKLAKVVKIYDDEDRRINNDDNIEIKVVDHKKPYLIGITYEVESKYFKKVDTIQEDKPQLGDLVKALPEADEVYNCTNSLMKIGEVVDILEDSDEDEDDIEVKILDSENEFDIEDSYPVKSKYFEIIGKKDVDIQGIKFDYDEDKDILFIIVKDKYTIAIEGAKSIGVASKSEYDKFDLRTGKAIAMARLKDTEEL